MGLRMLLHRLGITKVKVALLVATTLLLLINQSIAQTQEQYVVEKISWSPDGTKIAIAAGPQGCDPNIAHPIQILDVITGQVSSGFQGHTCRLIDIAWSPDGTKIATSGMDGYAFISDAASGQFLVTSRVVAEIGVLVVWSPDSTRIASIGSGGDYAIVWSATTGERLFNVQGHTAPTTAVAWNPNGSKLATAALDNTIKVWDITTQSNLLTISQSATTYSIAWSPDGARIAGGDSDANVKIWDSVTGQLLSNLQGHSEPVEKVAWSPDGTRIASGSVDATIRVWDAATGEQLGLIESTRGAIVDFAWSPDGGQIAYVGTNSDQSNLAEIVLAPHTKPSNDPITYVSKRTGNRDMPNTTLMA